MRGARENAFMLRLLASKDESRQCSDSSPFKDCETAR